MTQNSTVSSMIPFLTHCRHHVQVILCKFLSLMLHLLQSNLILLCLSFNLLFCWSLDSAWWLTLLACMISTASDHTKRLCVFVCFLFILLLLCTGHISSFFSSTFLCTGYWWFNTAYFTITWDTEASKYILLPSSPFISSQHQSAKHIL